MKNNKAIVITGPTASGKTALAVKLAVRFDAEIISVDSRQLYRGLDIGSGKDSAEYDLGYGKKIACHMIDVADPGSVFTLKDYCTGVSGAYKNITSRGKQAILCGGTALYLNALLSGYTLPGGGPDELLRARVKGLPLDELKAMVKRQSPQLFAELKDSNNRTRLLRCLEKAAAAGRQSLPPLPADTQYLLLAPYYPRAEIHRRIAARLEQRLNHGMVEEVRQLHEKGVSYERLEFFGLEYRYIALYLQGKLNYSEMQEQLLIKIRQFAKRQDIWFRKMERNNLDIYWLKNGNASEAERLVELFLADKKLPEPVFRLKEHFYGPKQ